MIPETLRQRLAEQLGDRVAFDAPLARHTSLRIGGPVEALVTPADRDELSRVLALCHAEGVRTRVLGAGFNVLVDDAGLSGVVLRLKKLRGIERIAPDAIAVEAGASHATITRFCVEAGLSGLEFGAGIPGTLGGWLAMNAGIGVREAKDVVRRVAWLGPDGAPGPDRERMDLDFRYRELAGLPEGAVLVGAELTVEPSEPAKVRDEVDRLLARRQATQPLDVPSCGSVFRNPPGDFAGRLIEAAGLKGTRVGDAEISTVHANFIVNRGRATAADVLALVEAARAAVLRESGVRLDTEVRWVGDGPPPDVDPAAAPDGARPAAGGRT